MEKIIYIPIDTSIDNTVECNKLVKRGDILTLQIKVFVDGALADLTGESIDLILKKSDGTLIEKNIDTANISNGVITATLSQQASLEQGIVSGEVKIYTADTLTSTNTFTYTVDSSLADDILEISQDDIQVLADLRNLINTGKITIEQYKESVLAIGNTVEAVQALANIKLYIDANLNDLENANAQAVVNIANETIENDNAIENIEDLTSKNAIALNNISDLDNKNATASQKISDLDSKNSSATTNISDLDNKNNTAINNIANLDSKNSTATNNISNLQTENTRAEANIVALENFGDATQLAQDVNAVKIELETARGGEANLDARLDKNDDLVASHTTQLSEKANPNVLINGDFQVWQRGTNFSNTQGYIADRWQYICYASSALGSVIKDSGGSIKMTNFNTSQNYISQIIETNLSEKLAGKKVTLSAEVKVSGMTQGSLFLQLLSSLGTDSINYTGAVMDRLVISQSDISSDYKKFSLTTTLPTTMKTLVTQIGSISSIGSGIVNSNCIVNIRNIKLELGSIATPFVPRPIGEELALCQRYYQIVMNIPRMSLYTTNYLQFNMPLALTMRSAPTCTVFGDTTSPYMYTSSTITQTGFTVTFIPYTSSITVQLNKATHGFTDGTYRGTIYPVYCDAEIY